jgi:hypothetical protein
MATRMTKSDLPQSLGAFNPVGHAVLAFSDDRASEQARREFVDAGFADEDLILYTSAELFPDMKEMLRQVGGAAGFGYQVQLMRRYLTLAGEGVGWLVVYAPDDAQIAKVRELAKTLGARSAVHYGRLAQEDLV